MHFVIRLKFFAVSISSALVLLTFVMVCAGVNAFKEVAWKSTHSILAACGLEQPKTGIRIFPSSACRHVSNGLDIRRSTLMPNSCRECFYAFVKDVVNTIMLEKIEGTEV